MNNHIQLFESYPYSVYIKEISDGGVYVEAVVNNKPRSIFVSFHGNGFEASLKGRPNIVLNTILEDILSSNVVRIYALLGDGLEVSIDYYGDRASFCYEGPKTEYARHLEYLNKALEEKTRYEISVFKKLYY